MSESTKPEYEVMLDLIAEKDDKKIEIQYAAERILLNIFSQLTLGDGEYVVKLKQLIEDKSITIQPVFDKILRLDQFVFDDLCNKYQLYDDYESLMVGFNAEKDRITQLVNTRNSSSLIWWYLPLCLVLTLLGNYTEYAPIFGIGVISTIAFLVMYGRSIFENNSTRKNLEKDLEISAVSVAVMHLILSQSDNFDETLQLMLEDEYYFKSIYPIVKSSFEDYIRMN